VQLADAILDYLDEDDEPREFGAELSYYSAMGLPGPRNGRIDALEELLNVRGVTVELLFGGDLNLDFLLDEEELRSGAASGWEAYLTATGRESTLRADRNPKLYLNGARAYELFDALQPLLGSEEALFIAAYRRYGSIDGVSEDLLEINPDERRMAAELRAAQQRTDELQAGVRGEATERTAQVRGGVELSGQPVMRIRSLADLCGASVRVLRDGQDYFLESPWSADARGLRACHARLAELVTPFAGDSVEGRIAVSQASAAVLECLPGVSADLAQRIVARRALLDRSRDDDFPPRDSAAVWLLEEGLVDWSTFQGLAPYLAEQGDVYLVRCLGTAGAGRHWEYLVGWLDTATSSIEVRYRSLQPAPAVLRQITRTGAR
jgi:DNA uptake protein ComE-like DNA-binding protein